MASLADKAAALGAMFSSALGSVSYFFNSFGQDLGSFLRNFSLGGDAGKIGGSGPFGSGAGLNPFFQLNMRDFSAGKNVIPNAEDFKNELGETLDIAPEDLKDISTETLLGLLQQVLPEEFATLMGGLTGATEADIQEWVDKSIENLIVDMLGLDGAPTYGDPNFLDYITEYYSFRNGTETERSVEYKDRRLTETVEQAFKDLGYNPSPEEIDELKKNPSGVAEYVDPRQVTNDEVIERLERLGVDVEGQAEAAGQTPEEYAEQIKQSVPPGDGSEAAFDDAMIMSLTSTAAGSTGSASFKEALSKMGTGVKNLLFGTNSGRPKPWLQILKEQIQKRYFPTFEDKMPGFPIALTFDLDGASAANPTGAVLRLDLKIPVPLPVNGPPISIPIFDQNGNYVNRTFKELFLEPDTGIIRQVEAGVVDTAKEIGRIFEGAQGAVIQVFDEVGNVFRAIPLAEYEAWKEGGKNPFDIETNENGEVIPQTDENGNPATRYDPDTGLPVYEKEEEEEEEEEEDDRLAFLSDVEAAKNEVLDVLGPEGSVGKELAALGLDAEEIKDILGAPAVYNAAGELVTEATGLFKEIGGAATPQDIVNAVGIPDDPDTEKDEASGIYKELRDAGLSETALGEVGDVVKTSLLPITNRINALSVAVGLPARADNPDTEEDESRSATGLYAAIDKGGAALNEFIGTAPTKDKDGNLVGGSGLLLTLAEQDVAIADLPAAVEQIVGAPANGNIPATGIYKELGALGITVGDIEDAIGNKDDGTGLYGYISSIRDDIVQNYIGSPAKDGTDATGVYLAIEQGNQAVIDLIGVPPAGTPEDVIALFNNSPTMQHYGVTLAYDPETNEFVRDNSGFKFTGDLQFTRYTPEEILGVLGLDTTFLSGTGLFATLVEQGVSIADLPAAVENLIGVPPEYDDAGKLVEGTGTQLYGEFLSLGYDVNALANTVGVPPKYDDAGELVEGTGTGLYGYISGIRDDIIQNYIGSPADGDIAATGLYSYIDDAIDGLDIPTDTVRSDQEIKDLAQGIVDNLDLPEDTQISDEDLTTAISTYLTDNGYITEDTTRTDEEINTLIGTALTGYATTTEVNTAITTAINALDIPTDTVRSDQEIKDLAQGIVDNLDLPEDTQISDEALTTAISTYLTDNGYITSTRTDEEINTLIGTALTGYATTTEVNTAITTAINALDIPTDTDTVRSDEEIKQIAQGIVDNLDLPEDTQISDEDLTTAISTYLTDNGYITEDTTRTDAEINTLIGTALTDYATVKGVQDTIDTYFGADGSVTKTLTALGFDTDEIKNIIGTPSNYTDPITKEVTEEATGMYALVEGAATPQDIINAVGAPTTNESNEVIGGTGLYGDLFTLGVDVERIEGAIGNKDEGTGLYGYIDTAVQDLATVADVERIVGVPDFIEGTDEDGNPTRELTGKSTGLYLDFYNAGVDYDTVINLIGVPDNPKTEDVNEGRGLFGYVGKSNEDVKTYVDNLLGDVPGQVTEIQGDVNTLVEYVGSPGADVDDPNTERDERLPTGLYRTLFNQGVAIDAIPGIIEGIVGVPEFGVDDDGNPTTEIVGGTGLYGEVVNLNTDVNTVIASINNTVIPQITEVAGFIGEPATVDEDGNVIPATGLHEIIEDYAGDSELRDGAITDAINKFTSDGQYTIEQVLTAIGDSNTDLKNFIGSPGADVDDPNTPEDETLPTGIYEGIAISEGRIIDAVSESEDNTNEYLTYISEIIGVPATDLTQEDIDFVVGLIGEDEAITEINNDVRIYDANFDGVINDIDIGILQGYVDIGVEGVGEIPASGLYGDAARRQFETQGFISDQDDATRGLISDEAKTTRGLMGATTLFNAMLGAGDISGRRVDVSTPDPARINYMYDFEDIFATPQQRGLFPSPYGKPQMAQQQQMAQRQGSTSGPLQIGGMAQGGKVDYDFTDEIMQIMRYGDS